MNGDGENQVREERQALAQDGFPTDDAWRRLSPKMLLIHPVKEVIRFLPALIAVVIAGSSGGQNWWGLVGAGVAVGMGLLRWFTTSYRFTAEQVQLRSGLINTTTVAAPMDRVRSVDVTSSVLHRMLGLAEVRIGTGAGEKQLRLNGLTTAEAAALRGDLLHRAQTSAPASPDTGTTAASGGAAVADGAAASYQQETVVYQLNPSWIRYAPFGPAGVVAAAAVLGIGAQFLNESGLGWSRSGIVRGTVDRLQGLGVLLAVLAVLVVVLVVVVVLALLGYLLAFHGFRLTRDDTGGTYHVSRGLLTTRATSLEIRRMRGVEIHRALPLRWVGGARLTAITTGVKDDDRGMSTTLAPPSPLPVVTGTAGAVLGDAAAEVPLQRHGPHATMRRYTRAVGPALALAAALAAAAVVWSLPVLAVCGVLVLAAGVALGWSRARWLGHAVTDRFLVTRAGSIALSTNVIERRGAVGVTVRRSFFQRRAGVATVGLATAAGTKEYPVLDVPQEQVAKLAAQILPGHVEQFLR